MAAKRKRNSDEEESHVDQGRSNPRKTRRAQVDSADDHSGDTSEQSPEAATPIKTISRRGRPPRIAQKSKFLANGMGKESNGVVTPSKLKGNRPFSTPSKPFTEDNGETENSTVRNADRSARRKSARTLIDTRAVDGLSEEDDLEEEDLLAKKIWDADEAQSDDDQDEVEDELAAESATPATPSKRKRGQRKKSLTPPQNLPPHEQYFWENRPGKIKTSNNTLSSVSLLSHEQYHNQMSAYEDPHESSYDFLHSLHSRSFPQWRFELSQSFNICLYGYGSKRKLVTSFAEYLHNLTPSTPPKILIVNGYTPTLTLWHLLTNLATLIYNSTPSTLPPKLPTQPYALLTTLLTHLTNTPPPHPYKIFINSLDAPPLRRPPNPSLLAQLASNPHINLLATCDHPNFALLWDVTLRDQYNFLFHDTTTFISYAGVEIPSVIDSVNELLGRSGRSIKGKEGVGFVLRSLPENARNLYRVLIAELLAAMDEDGGGAGVEGQAVIEYKVLYQKVVEEFICSNEMGFRQLLKEFHDHEMVVDRKEGLGVPFRREEMESILEGLME